MRLQGQGGERGYAMAALLVSIAVMSVLMGVALPTWRHAAQREKEAELVFRGEQYARAVALYRAKNANAFPPSIDVLVQGKYLRKKYLDPITNKDFDVIGVGPQAGQTPAGQNTGRGAGNSNTPASAGQQGRGGLQPTPPQASGAPGAVVSGIMGVHSKSTDDSIRIYNGQTKYNLWNFVFTALNRPGGGNAPGAATPGAPGGTNAPGMPSGPGQGRGQGQGQGNGRSRGPGTELGRNPAGRGRSGDFNFPPSPGTDPQTTPMRPGRGGGQ